MYYPNYYLEAEEFLQGKRNFLRRTTKIRRKTVSRARAHGFGRISDCPLRSYLRHCGRCYCVSRVIQPVYAKTARYSLIVVYSETMPLYLSPTRAASFLVPSGGPLPPPFSRACSVTTPPLEPWTRGPRRGFLRGEGRIHEDSRPRAGERTLRWSLAATSGRPRLSLTFGDRVSRSWNVVSNLTELLFERENIYWWCDN